MLTPHILSWLKANGYANSDINADSAEPRLIAELRSNGINRIHRAKKPNGSIMFGIDFIQGFEIIVHQSCKHTIDELNSYAFAKNKDDEWLNKPIDKDNHLMDALRYAMEQLIMPKVNTTDRMQAFKELGLGR